MSRTPTTTYRLQLRREFTLHDAAAVVPYLADLGISHVYCSPVLRAVPGSPHGYDVIDHSRLSEDLGGDAGWAALTEACDRRGLGLVVDVVPNHMAAPTPERLNLALWDVLRLGRESAFAHWFDIDWTMHHGRLLVPVLGQSLDDCVSAGDVTVDPAAGVVRYFDHEFPMAPGTSSLDEQHYLLCDWRRANQELNYRRFFDVTTLLGVRVEDVGVFDATHRRIFDLPGPLDGLRIDHPDGLADPTGYLDRLAASGDRWVVAEKILEVGEGLPASWHCDGTTGYDALNVVLRLLVDASSAAAMTDLYVELTGMPAEFASVVEASKRQILADTFGAELSRLLRDWRQPELLDALVEVLVALDVYRGYDDPASRQRLSAAAERARERRPDLGEQIAAVLSHVGEPRFQQTTGPVMAKGVEDTALYRWHRLVALNEVGGDPSVYGADVDTFHAWCSEQAASWPRSMTTLSTHDTKRSADVRARLAVLSEIPDEWRTAVTRWRAVAARHHPPDANTDYLMWQTLVGTWPISTDRLTAYLEKASREAKLQTSWTDPLTDYDERLRGYATAVLADDALTNDLAAWIATHVQAPGESNSLTQRLVQLLLPGVPDVYQGDELLDLSLVDPDNRRAVDYDARRAALADFRDPKLRVTATAARLRRDRPELVGASYRALPAAGAAAQHVVAFLRGEDVAVIATRLPVGLRRRGGWGDSTVTLPGAGWHDLLTGHQTAGPHVADVLRDLPVALLVRDRG